MNRLKYSLSLFVIVLAGATVTAQTERSRTIEESWSNMRHVSVDHRYGQLNVIPDNSGQVRLRTVISVTATDAADAQTTVDHFNISMKPQGDRLVLVTEFPTKRWNTTLNNTSITFDDGTKVKGIKDLDITYNLYVPDLSSLSLSNKYKDIVIEDDITGDLSVKQYDAEVLAKNVAGKLDLNIKYGKAKFGNTGNADVNLYDAELELEKAEAVTLISKYSDLTLGHCTTLDIRSYDDDIQITTVAGPLKVSDKYSDIEVGSAESSEIESYDSEIKLDRTGQHSGVTKYSTYVINTAQSVSLEKSYDDEFEVGTLGSLSCSNSKYTTYRIASLSDKMSVGISYDDEIDVKNVSSSFSAFNIDSKYTSVKLPLHQLTGYSLEANTKYGTLKYPEPAQNVKHIEKGGSLEINAKIGSGSGANIKITAYDSQIRLN